ncbi:MAG: sodium:proton antiporter [Candidatus Hodarchaeota archaeon]
MNKVIAYSLLLILGLVGSQIFPKIIGSGYSSLFEIIQFFMNVALSYIMIRVGFEFEVDKLRIRSYGWDYVVAMTSAAFPWILVAIYFIFLLTKDYMASWSAWEEILLVSRFCAPTSAGVLFSMLAAAGLGATWVFTKVRILAIFDDLDTIILLVPLQIMIIGLEWQLGVVVPFILLLLIIAWKYFKSIKIKYSWKWLLFYALLITSFCEVICITSKMINKTVPIHLEVLLPAFVLGAIIKHSENKNKNNASISTIISMIFMFLVGLSMPQIAVDESTMLAGKQTITAQQPMMSWITIAFHVLMITIISNIGKMFPLLCYRKEARWNERLAICIGMWPRGEVGAGILIISLNYGIGGPFVIIAMLSLALNLLLTGLFIYFVKNLIQIDKSCFLSP